MNNKKQKKLTDKQKEKVISLIYKMKPLMDGGSGAYLGIYEENAKKICDIFGWSYHIDNEWAL